MAVKRVIFKRMLDGDLRKLRTESANATSGGGARDLRFGPWDRFEPVVDRMLPDKVTRRSRRKVNGRFVPQDVEGVAKGDVRWQSDGVVHEKPFEFWPPTDSRAFEGRVATTYKLPPLAPDRLPPAAEGIVFGLIWEDDDGVWAQYASEAAVRNPPAGEPWEPTIREALLEGLDGARAKEARQKRRNPVSIRGFVDREHDERAIFVGAVRG